MANSMQSSLYYWITDPVEEYLPVRKTNNFGGKENPKNITFEVFQSGRLITGQANWIVGEIPSPAATTLTNINEDLVANDDISEASILWSLKSRFFVDKIYSSIGSIIIAINPYKNIQELYSTEVLNSFMNTTFDSPVSSPHIWKIAHGAYVQVRLEVLFSLYCLSYSSSFF